MSDTTHHVITLTV